MDSEISKKIVAIVLILAIIVSAYFTLMALRGKASFGEEQRGNTVQAAKVSLTVQAPEPAEELEGDTSAEEGGVA